MQVLEVGKPYIEGKTNWPEAIEYNFYDNGHELRIFLPNLQRTEIEAIKKGKVDFGLLVEEGIIFLLSKFFPMQWADSTYHYSMVPQQRSCIPETTSKSESIFLQILLIEAETGILKVIRGVTLTPQFSKILQDSIIAQMENPLDRPTYNERIDRVYDRYPQTIDMVKACQIFN